MPSVSQAARFREACKFITQIKEISDSISDGENKYDVTDFNARFSLLASYKTKLDKVFYEILDSKDLDDKTNTAYTEKHDTCSDFCIDVLTVHEKLKSASAHSAQNPLPLHSPPSLSTAAVLPKIQLPKFSSKVEDWPSFYTVFKSLTGDMTHLSDAVKLHYLLSCLSGQALSMVSHLKITDGNFQVAMDILTGRYENRRVLIDRFVDIILGLPDITVRSDVRALFLTPLVSAQSALVNLELPMNDSDYMFVSIVVRKLKGELRTLFERRCGSSSSLPTLKDLVSFLEEHARCVETEWSGSTSSAHPAQPIHKPTFRRQSPTPLTQLRYNQPRHEFRPVTPVEHYPVCMQIATQPTHTTQHTRTSTDIHCPYCRTYGHRLIACPQYNNQSVEIRWDFINARNRCQRCLGPHCENECRSTRACKECGDSRHHTSLHHHGENSCADSSQHHLPTHVTQARQRQHVSAHAQHHDRSQAPHTSSAQDIPAHTGCNTRTHTYWSQRSQRSPSPPAHTRSPRRQSQA